MGWNSVEIFGTVRGRHTFLYVGFSVVDGKHRRRQIVFHRYAVDVNLLCEPNDDGKRLGSAEDRGDCCFLICIAAHSNNHRHCALGTNVSDFWDPFIVHPEGGVLSRTTIEQLSPALKEVY